MTLEAGMRGVYQVIHAYELEVYRAKTPCCGTRSKLASRVVVVLIKGLLAALFFYCAILTGFTQTQHSGNVVDGTANLFNTDCGVCHGSDGRGGERAPNIATRRETMSLADTQLTRILKKGVLASGMPAFDFLGDERIMQLVHYLRKLQGMAGAGEAQLTGDAADGEKTFLNSCARCHMMHGQGGFLGEDLSTYARGRSADVIRAAILHPVDAPDSADRLVDVKTSDGTSLRGLIRFRDNFNLVLQDEDGGYHSISRDQLRQMKISSEALMPQDYASTLEEKQLVNLVTYLIKSSAPGPHPSKSDKDNGKDD